MISEMEKHIKLYGQAAQGPMARMGEPMFTRKDIEAAVLAEREACAKMCKWVFENRYTAFDLEAQEISENCAAAIRARGE